MRRRVSKSTIAAMIAGGQSCGLKPKNITHFPDGRCTITWVEGDTNARPAPDLADWSDV